MAAAADVPSGTARLLSVAGRPIVVANVDGEFYAVGGICTHAHWPFVGAQLEGYRLICPRHYAEFDVRTGEQVKWAYGGPLRTFPVKQVGDTLFVMAPA